MISDLTVNITGNYGGLFGYTGEHAEIRSLGLSDVNIMAGNNGGGLVGYNNGSISNSYSTGAVSASGALIGGLVGTNDGSISSSYSTSSVEVDDASVGGLVGINNGNISNSYATGNVEVDDASVGGLVGVNNGNISNSYATGNVASTATAALSGGLVGINNGNISNSYAAGTANTSASPSLLLGGLVGSNFTSISGINYFADDVADSTTSIAGSNGIGGGSASSCAAAVCKQATGANYDDRLEWLEDSLDETDDSGLNWDAQLDDEGNAVWGKLNDDDEFPCLKNMPENPDEPSCD